MNHKMETKTFTFLPDLDYINWIFVGKKSFEGIKINILY